MSVKSRARRLWRTIHLWLGIGLAVLIVPISLSGAFLVWHDEFDALINPHRYAVTSGPAQPPSALMMRASEAAGPGYRPALIRLPEKEGAPATVMVRAERRAGNERPPALTVYLDPATARMLDVVEFRYTLVGFMHRFHENLTIPEYYGRSIVGWSGVALLVMALSGIYLWWPRGSFLRGLRWRRGPTLSYRLHHTAGFWISIPLAVVSLTGIVLAFPQESRQLVSGLAPVTPPQRGGFNAPLLRETGLTADKAMAAALSAEAGAQVVAIFAPTQPSQTWRVQMLRPDMAGSFTVLVDDRDGAVRPITQHAGDRILLWIRWIHEGSNSGLAWKLIVFVCGLLPTVLTVTGVVMWWRGRAVKRAKRDLRLPATPKAHPAE